MVPSAPAVHLKTFIQNTVHRAGFEIIRRPHDVRRPLDLLGLLIRDELTRTPEFFFLQVGANDGVSDDMLRPSILRHKLHGAFVEPLPDLFTQLQQNYAGHSGLTFLNCAIGETTGARTMYRVRPDAPLPTAVQALASFDRRNLTTAKQGVPNLDRYVESITVETSTFQEITSKLPPITMLMVDTEGYDAAIVGMALDAGVRPPLLVYEHIHLPVATQADTLRRLVRDGYRFIEFGMDTYAALSDTGDSN